MLIVCDTSPITNLIQLGKLDLLIQLFDKIIIPSKVYDELIAYEGQEIEIKQRAWISRKTTNNYSTLRRLKRRLDEGEAEAIALAQELDADLLIIDERKGRSVAQDYNLRIIGLLGILILAKKKGHIDKLNPLLDTLIFDIGFHINENLRELILNEVNE